MAFFQNKIVLLILVGVAVAGVVWYSFLRADEPRSLLQSDENALTSEVSAVEGDIVEVLMQLRAVSLSGTIFSDPVFLSLIDFGSEIVDEPAGRENPFAPLETSNTAPPSGPKILE